LLAFPLRVVLEQNARVIPNPLGDGMHGHAAVQQQRRMRPAKMVELEIGEAKLYRALPKLLGEAVRVPRLRERKILAGAGRVGENQSFIRQPDQAQVNLNPVWNARTKPLVRFP